MRRAEMAEELRDRPLGELLGRLSEETAELVREELALAKIEMSEKGRIAGRASVFLVAGGVLAFLGLAALTAAIIFALNFVFQPWLSSLIVAVVYLVVAGILFLVGRGILKRAGSPIPEQTVETVKEDVQWLRERSRSATT